MQRTSRCPLSVNSGHRSFRREQDRGLRDSHQDCMSNDAILPFLRRKTKSRVIGLPGKLPETFVATIVFPSRFTTASGSNVCRYLSAVSRRHATMSFSPYLVRPSSLTCHRAQSMRPARRGRARSRRTGSVQWVLANVPWRAASPINWLRRALKNAPPPTNSAPAPDFSRVEKAALISSSLAALSVMIFYPIARTVVSISRVSV